jgi:hypothetical protein
MKRGRFPHDPKLRMIARSAFDNVTFPDEELAQIIEDNALGEQRRYVRYRNCFLCYGRGSRKDHIYLPKIYVGQGLPHCPKSGYLTLESMPAGNAAMVADMITFTFRKYTRKPLPEPDSPEWKKSFNFSHAAIQENLERQEVSDALLAIEEYVVETYQLTTREERSELSQVERFNNSVTRDERANKRVTMKTILSRLNDIVDGNSQQYVDLDEKLDTLQAAIANLQSTLSNLQSKVIDESQ